MNSNPQICRALIVHLDTGKDLRGGQHQLLILARGLRKRGHGQLLVCPEESALEARARQEDFRVFPLPSHDPAHAHGLLELRRRIQSDRFDIIHAHDGRGHTLAWLATLGLPTRRVATRRVIFAPSRPTAEMFRRTSTCHAIVAVSRAIERQLVGSGVPADKIEVIPDGIEWPAELPSGESRLRVRSSWGFGDREFVAGHVGAFTPEKGQDVAIGALVQLAERLPGLRLVLAGDGPDRSSTAVAAELRKASGRVLMLGYVQDLSDFFAGIDLFVMPSRAEGLGSSVLLAMAHGLPVIASRVGGLPEIVEDGETGWLVPPDSASALAEAISRAAANPVRLREFGEKGRAQARQFSGDIMVERTETLYHRLGAR